MTLQSHILRDAVDIVVKSTPKLLDSLRICGVGHEFVSHKSQHHRRTRKVTFMVWAATKATHARPFTLIAWDLR